MGLVAHPVFKTAEAFARGLVGSIPTLSRHNGGKPYGVREPRSKATRPTTNQPLTSGLPSDDGAGGSLEHQGSSHYELKRRRLNLVAPLVPTVPIMSGEQL